MVDTSSVPLILKFALVVPDVWEALGNLPRSGWVKREVTDPESVQRHTIAVMHCANFFSPFGGFGHQELLDMLEVHDWPESDEAVGDRVILVGDPDYDRLKAEKFQAEKEALTKICKPHGDVGAQIMGFWLRYEMSPDPIARFARQLDKYQAVEQALEYEKTQGRRIFKEFLDNARPQIGNHMLAAELDRLEAEWRQLQ